MRNVSSPDARSGIVVFASRLRASKRIGARAQLSLSRPTGHLGPEVVNVGALNVDTHHLQIHEQLVLVIDQMLQIPQQQSQQ